MSIDAQIKTGLKLSEAIKLIEENNYRALIRINTVDNRHDFENVDLVDLSIYYNYDIKLPPPKSVSVTRDFVYKAYIETCKEVECNRRSLLETNFDLNLFLSKLGL